jgi:hypothetical protein
VNVRRFEFTIASTRFKTSNALTPRGHRTHLAAEIYNALRPTFYSSRADRGARAVLVKVVARFTEPLGSPKQHEVAPSALPASFADITVDAQLA